MKANFFTVADPNVGLGHLFRCDALAEALTLKGVTTELIVHCNAGDTWLREKPLRTAWKNLRWTDDSLVVEKELRTCDIPVFDAYAVSKSIWDYLANCERACVLFDDFGEKPELKGLLINGSPGAFNISYSDYPARKLLLGPEFQVLRPPFWKFKHRLVKKIVETVGIIIGGTDSNNLIEEIIGLVRNNIDKNIQIIIVGDVPIDNTISNVSYVGFLRADEVKDLFEELDLLISAAGQSIAEAVSCHVPFLMMKTAGNQETNIYGWKRILSIPAIDTTDYRTQIIINLNVYMDYSYRVKKVRLMETIDINNSTLYLAKYIREYFA